MPKSKADQSNSSETFDETTHPFECFRCSKRFTSSFSLGGHQNAHKKERSEEARLINERRRLARLSHQSNIPAETNIPSSTPNPIVPHGIAEAKPSFSPMVQVLRPMVPGFMCMYGHEKSLVFVPAGFKYGSIMAGINGGEAPYEDREDADEKSSKGEELDLTLRL